MKNKEKKEKKVFNAENLNYDSVETVFAEAEKEGDCTKYPLRAGVTLTIREGENLWDYGNLNIFGVCVNVTFRGGKNGVFMSLPAYKTGGEYRDHVIIFDENLRNTIDAVVKRHYKVQRN